MKIELLPTQNLSAKIISWLMHGIVSEHNSLLTQESSMKTESLPTYNSLAKTSSRLTCNSPTFS